MPWIPQGLSASFVATSAEIKISFGNENFMEIILRMSPRYIFTIHTLSRDNDCVCKSKAMEMRE